MAEKSVAPPAGGSPFAHASKKYWPPTMWLMRSLTFHAAQGVSSSSWDFDTPARTARVDAIACSRGSVAMVDSLWSY